LILLKRISREIASVIVCRQIDSSIHALQPKAILHLWLDLQRGNLPGIMMRVNRFRPLCRQLYCLAAHSPQYRCSLAISGVKAIDSG
jgi:hypothetical protein